MWHTQEQEKSLAAEGSVPRRGQTFPGMELPDRSGRTVRISDYRGRRNLVIAFLGKVQPGELALLRELAQRHDDFRREEAEVLAVVAVGEIHQPLPFPLLLDQDRDAHRRAGAGEETAIYVTDRWAEILVELRPASTGKFPRAGDLLEWVDFANRQCPECYPSEWPLD